MAIDPSIAAGQAPSNNLLGMLSGITQLKGVQQQQQANVAASQAYKQATDPTTGQIDYNALTAALSQGPAAYNLPQIQAQINEARNSALNYDKGKLELAQKRTDLLSGGFGGLLASGNITPQAVMQIASQGIRQGLFTPEDAVSFTSDMPTDPGQLRDWVKQKTVGFSQDSDRVKMLLPQMQTINTGGQQIVTPYDPTTGAPMGQNTVFNNTMTPGDANSFVQVFDPSTGTMRNVTKAQAAAMANGGGQPQQGYVPDTSGGSLGTGRLQPITGGAPGLQAAPALGSAEAMQVVGKGAAENSLALQRQSDAAPQSIYQLQNMRTALADINTGPGTYWRNTAASFATALSPDIAQKIGIDPQKIASYDEFKKYATQAAQATMASLGEGTDSKIASAVAANPNTDMSKLGAQQIIDTLIAGQQGIKAKNQAWQQSGLPPEQYNKFSTQWSKEIDPRVFAAQNMDNAQVKKMVESLPKREQTEFMNSWMKAQSSGWVK